MSVAVVFDSAGTLLHTYRVAKNVLHNKLETGIETTLLPSSCEEWTLIILYTQSRDIINAPPKQLLSTFLVENNIHYGVTCASRVVPSGRVGDILYNDKSARINDLQDCIRKVWSCCKKEPVVTMNNGVMVNHTLGSIEYVITSGGRPFLGVKSTIRKLHEMGVATYIASGDSTEKLIKMADCLGIPHDNVHGVSTPSIKAQIVEDLKKEYDVIVMVGDGINDIKAMKKADIAILTEQQSDKKSGTLRNSADYIIKNVTEVVDIVKETCMPREMSDTI
ncbi:MAG: HAD-IC family P-type ATPase [Euryarchaeota archaeon]|nr:HAD-IC family P-type ATPase [Euryarchaeota archaeon]